MHALTQLIISIFDMICSPYAHKPKWHKVFCFIIEKGEHREDIVRTKI